MRVTEVCRNSRRGCAGQNEQVQRKQADRSPVIAFERFRESGLVSFVVCDASMRVGSFERCVKANESGQRAGESSIPTPSTPFVLVKA